MPISKEKQLQALSKINNELTEGIKQLSKFGLKRWKYNVTELDLKIGLFDKKVTSYLNLKTESSSKRMSSKITMEEELNLFPLPDDELKKLYSFLYEIIQAVRNLLVAYHIIDAQLTKAIIKYCKLLNEICSTTDTYLTDFQLNHLFHDLFRGATYPSISAKFQGGKKTIKNKIQKSLTQKLDDYKRDRISSARNLLSKQDNEETQIEHELINFIDFRRLTTSQKKSHYECFKNLILEILEMQKTYALNPAFANTIGKLMMYLHVNIEIKSELSLQTAAKQQQNNLLTGATTTKSQVKQIIVTDQVPLTIKKELCDEFNSIISIRDKLNSGITELSTSFINKAWNHDVGVIKNTLKLLNENIAKFVSDKPLRNTEIELNTLLTQDELKEIFDLLFKLMLAICQLLSTYRLNEVDLAGSFIEYCQFLISTYTKLLRDFEMRCITCNDQLFDLKKIQHLEPLFTPEQLTEIYNDLYDGATWPSKSAYFNEYRRQKKQELAASLEFIREELHQEVLHAASNKLSGKDSSNLKVKPTPTLNFKRYDNEQRKDVYKELEYYFFEVLELQKESPLNKSLASAVEKFILGLKKNYDKTQTAMIELLNKTKEQEYFKNTFRTLSYIAGRSDLKDNDKVNEIKKLLPNQLENYLQNKADKKELEEPHRTKLIKL